MANKFYEKKEYFWEHEFPFGEDFLRSIFPSYRRKFSMTGNGIYNLVTLDNKLYNITLKSTKGMLPNDGKSAFRDPTKDKVIAGITTQLNQLGIEYSVNSGKYITFPLFGTIAKIEIVKKTTEPA